jgi:uncharacterized membrane protein
LLLIAIRLPRCFVGFTGIADYLFPNSGYSQGMRRPPSPLVQLATRIENAEQLDRVATRIQEVFRRVMPPAAAGALRGEPLGHPLHPALVSVPIGAWASASVLDVLGEGGAARKLIAVGCLTAMPTAAAGAADWVNTTGARRRTGLVHAAVNDTALATYLLSWRARRRGDRMRGVILSLAGAGLLGVGGWLGGHLTYSQGVGVDTGEFRERAGHSDAVPDGMVVVEPSEA